MRIFGVGKGLDEPAPGGRVRRGRLQTGWAGGKVRWIAALVLVISGTASGALAVWSIAQSPFAQLWVPAAEQEIRSRLTTAVAREVSDAWLDEQLESALAEDPIDWIEVGILEDIAEAHELSASDDLTARLEALRPGLGANAMSCARCALMPGRCDLGQLFYCRLPIEMTPVGDISILATAGSQIAGGGEIDNFDVAMASVGLAATAVAIPSGGSSISLKAGATTLRMARRAGVLTGRLTREVGAVAARLIRWDRIPTGTRRLSAEAWVNAMDPAALGTLSRLGADIGVVTASMPAGQAASVLRHADSIEDVARLSRVAGAQGDRTVHALRVIGKSRALRATVRINRAVISFLAGMAMLLLSIFGLIAGFAQSFGGWWFGRRFVRHNRESRP